MLGDLILNPTAIDDLPLELRTKPITFKLDPHAETIKSFAVDGNKIKMLHDNHHAFINHREILPLRGNISFAVRIIQSHSNIIFLGVGTKDLKQCSNTFSDPLFVGLYLHNGHIYGNGTNESGPHLEIVPGKTIIRTLVKMTEGVVEWYCDRVKVASFELNERMRARLLYPYLSLYSFDDQLEMISG